VSSADCSAFKSLPEAASSASATLPVTLAAAMPEPDKLLSNESPMSWPAFGEFGPVTRPAYNNSLDDRAGVRWLMAQRQPGDVLLTTHFGLPAVWWYGGVDVAPPDRGGTAGDLPIYRVGVAAACAAGSPFGALAGHRRALVYLGFRFDDVPDDFDDRMLAGLGRVVAERRFAVVGRALVVELDPPPGPPARCLALEPAGRW